MIRMERVLALLTAIILLAMLAPVAVAKEVTISILHARMGPVYQKLPDGTVIEVYADIYYPDKLIHRPPNILGTVNFTIHTNWSGPWDGIITVQVVDPGYRIDPTLFKPVESMWEWGEGGATIGSGNIHAPVNPVYSKTVNRTVEIIAHERYFNATPGVYKAQYFFRIRLAFFDPKTGQKLPGGDINIYTVSDGAPYVEIIVPPSHQDNGSKMFPMLLRNLGLAAGIAATAYIAIIVYERRRVRTS